MQKLWQRIKTLWYLSGVTKEDLQENPQLFTQMVQKAKPQLGYIVGFSEEEQNFANSLNRDNKDTKLS
jgi:hypothetical protein